MFMKFMKFSGFPPNPCSPCNYVIIILGAAAATHQAAEDVESGGEPLQALGRAKLDLCGALKRLLKFVQLRESQYHYIILYI